MIAWVSVQGLDREAFGDLLVQEGVEPVLPFAHRIDIVRHLVAEYGRACSRVTGPRWLNQIA